MGVSKKFLFNKTYEYFFALEGPSIDAPDRVRSFLQELSPLRHHFIVYLVVPDLFRTLNTAAKSFDVKVLDTLPPQAAALAATNGFAARTDECFVEVGNITGYDVYSAQEEAAATLDKVSDLFTLFYHKGKVASKGRAIVEQCCLDGPVLVEVSAGPMQKAFDMQVGRASRELNQLLENFAASDASRDKFFRVADLHGICVSSDVVDNQLVNLWTALETLVPTHTGGSSSIVKMTEAMLPFLLLAYVRRLVMRLSHDLVVWRPWKVKSILNKLPERRGTTMLERTLCLLCDPAAQPVRDQLYAELGSFPLLRNRVYQLAETLKDPKSVEALLDTHERKVRWQIRRIYRTRNLIVHSGRKPSYVHTLIENGHDYLDQILFDVMKMCCGEYRATTLEQAFELGKLRHQRFRRTLSGLKSFDGGSYVFLCEERDSLESIVTAPWGYVRKDEADAAEAAAEVTTELLKAAAKR
jgi:hypothetical protein